MVRNDRQRFSPLEVKGIWRWAFGDKRCVVSTVNYTVLCSCEEEKASEEREGPWGQKRGSRKISKLGRFRI